VSEQRVVSVVTFHVTAKNFGSISEEVNKEMQDHLSTVPGLIEATLLANEQATRLIVVSTWESKQSWAVAQWDDGIERTIADLFQKTASYDLDFYNVLTKVA